MTPVYFTQCPDYQAENIKRAVRDCLEALRDTWPSPGSRILIKPNFVLSTDRRQAALTDPEVIRAIIEFGCEQKWQMILGDSPAFGKTEHVAKRLGLTATCKANGVDICTLSGAVGFPGSEENWTICQQVGEVDAVINLPKLKGHQQLYYTGAIKNLYGCVSGFKKAGRHFKCGDKNRGRSFATMLLDSADRIAPVINLIDGVVAMQGCGPIRGQAVPLGLMGASVDPLTLDHAVMTFLGADLERDPIYRRAKESDLWNSRLNADLHWLGEPMAPPAFQFPSPQEMMPIRFSPRIVLRSLFKRTAGKLLGTK